MSQYETMSSFCTHFTNLSTNNRQRKIKKKVYERVYFILYSGFHLVPEQAYTV